MKIQYSDEEIDAMSETDACNAVENAVREACQIFERLEQRGKITGNGHHARQRIADFAAAEIMIRWLIKTK